ncbi:MAG TPA: hypothetical protein VGD27_13260 [Longimicrobiales bacterium]
MEPKQQYATVEVNSSWGAMKNLNRRKWSLLSATLAAVIVAACAASAGRRTASLPVPCADSTYVHLKRQHPDSLSEREWQRFKTLDSACTQAETHARSTDANRSAQGGRMGISGGVAAGFMTVLMAAMMVTMW